jgi:hypothetical protein
MPTVAVTHRLKNPKNRELVLVALQVADGVDGGGQPQQR